jgi:phage tail-like protein
MAEFRERPYSQFNYTVDLGNGEQGIRAGFQEVSGLGVEVNVAEYRAGNSAENVAMKITGTHKIPDVTLKRGSIGSNDLSEWLNEVQSGSQDALRDVVISLLSEDRSTVAQTWTLRNARPIKYTGPALNAKGTDVAVEELVLACEGMVFG